ncbi:crotonase/enoyl-CoA hydratase family protein [Acinetobacter terrae]|uniref:Crotonase/enoyl-CoA hydratase family protein n=1 Tax=Acinetobacter terrae TaxID=2731247 RepID=A0A8E4H5U4_9GAMM|nr:crotonase/enoyl-CoA hydratase family protein [Acinetobacter terrae]NNH39708.1 crotonase/enoyl-CoA hydratase family protein [Acinetobacter terrae]NNH87183.1 crotonase/enoyl-CoA hydratase family protein [Acinetobacter terrae]
MSQQQGKVSREIRGSLFLIGLDRATKRNAFDSNLIHDLSRALTEYEDDSELRCAVIFAHGDHFTAGLDLVELQPKLSSGIFSYDEHQINPWGTSGRQRKKPVIVAVQGFCYTAGIELMLNADIVIAQDNSQFAQMEVQRGILPFGGATVRFVQAAGWAKAMRYLLTGDAFDAQTALDLNLINEITTEAPLNRAIELAERIAQAAPLAVQATLASAKEAAEHGAETAFAHLQQHLTPLLKTQDVQEGVMAMLQRRAPEFKGQ